MPVKRPEDEVVGAIAGVRAGARGQVDAAGGGRLPRFVAPGVAPPPEPADPPAPELPAPPDASAVNESWRPPPSPAGAVVGALQRVIDRLIRRPLSARVRFDAEQVRFDNDLLGYVTTHFAATHRHYDRLLAAASVRMDEIDERHRQGHQQIAAAIDDLARRLDLVLEAAERSRLSGEADLRRLAPRLEEVERRLEELERRGGG